MKFDGLLLIDCWEDKWIHISKNQKARQFYKNIIEFISKYSFGNVYFFTNSVYGTHECFHKHFSNNVIEVTTVDQILGETFLVGGAAWNLCLHDPVLPSFATLARAGKTVYSCPSIVDSDVDSAEPVTEDMFKYDRRIRWVKQNNLFCVS